MARGAPVTIDDVGATLRALEDAGVKPTVRLVRQKLGRGSLSTITAHLRGIAATRAESDVGELPDPVLASLRTAADTVWRELAEAADARIETVTRAADEKVTQAQERQAAVERALADVSDERGALVATLAARDTQLGELEQTKDTLVEALAAAEQRAAVTERDRAALALRLDDRDAELARALAAVERTEAACAAATDERERLGRALEAEIARREVEGTERAFELERLRRTLETMRTEAAELASAHTRLEAQLVAAGEQTREVAARTETLGHERDAALERATRLDAQLEQARQAAAAAEHRAASDRRALRTLSAHVEQLETALRAAGIAAADIPPRPVSPAPDAPRSPPDDEPKADPPVTSDHATR